MTAPAAPTDSATVVLEAGGSRVEIRPALGGRLTSLRLAGREWLTAGTNAGGGYRECLPTVGACEVDVPGVGRVALPDGGEAAGQHAATERADAPAGAAAAVTRWTGERLAYAFTRTLTVQPDGAVRAEYVVASRAAAPVPFLWSAHAVLPLAPDTRLDLPVAARVRVWDAEGVALGARGAEHRWPVLRVGARGATRFGPREVDFTFPALAPHRFGDAGGAAYAATLFLDLPRTPGKAVRLGVEQGGGRLDVAVDPGEVPHLRLRIDRGGGTPADGHPGHSTLSLAPCIGAGDTLDAAPDAAGGWGPATWLAPGETRRWSLTWRGRAAPASA